MLNKRSFLLGTSAALLGLPSKADLLLTGVGKHTVVVPPSSGSTFVAVSFTPADVPAFSGSNNGTSWSNLTPDPATDFDAVAVTFWSNKYVVVGTDAAFVDPRISTSPDGSVWTSRTAPSDNQLSDVAGIDSLPLCVVCGLTSVGPSILTSPDGVTWTQRTFNPNVGTENPICVAANSTPLFVVCGNVSVNPLISTSPDGVTWTPRTPDPATAFIVRAICWDSALSLFIAVGSGAAGIISTSPDGITWTQRTVTTAAGTILRGVASNGSIIVAVGFVFTGTNDPIIRTSPDGITWTARTPSPTSSWAPLGITWSQTIGLFVTVDNSSTHVMTSPDGVTWTEHTTGSAANFLIDVAASS